MKKSEFRLSLSLQFRLAIFLSLIFAGLMLCAEAAIRLLSPLFGGETLWYIVLGGAFVAVGACLGLGIAKELRVLFGRQEVEKAVEKRNRRNLVIAVVVTAVVSFVVGYLLKYL